MTAKKRIVAILPALDEEGAVAGVVSGFRDEGVEALVVDNGSRDRTAQVARRAGARVVREAERGYGAACMAGIDALRDDPPDVVVFADCDGTIDPKDIAAMVQPLDAGVDMTLGRRDRVEGGALPLRNRMAKWGCTAMFFLFYGRRLRDVPPLRAVRWDALQRLPLGHPTYGFPVESVAVALRRRLRIEEVPVAYRRRAAGVSKVGVGLVDALRVGLVMAATTVRLRFRRLPE